MPKNDPFSKTRRLIRRYRKAHGQTQQEVADAIGISRYTYLQLENGPRKIFALELAALCEFWGKSYNSMFETAL